MNECCFYVVFSMKLMSHYVWLDYGFLVDQVFVSKLVLELKLSVSCTQCSWSTTWSHPIHPLSWGYHRVGLAVSRAWPTGPGHCWLRTSPLLLSFDSGYCKHCLANSRFSCWLSIIGQRYPASGWGRLWSKFWELARKNESVSLRTRLKEWKES